MLVDSVYMQHFYLHQRSADPEKRTKTRFTLLTMSKQNDIEKDFLQPDLKKDGKSKYFEKIGVVVKKHRDSQIELNTKTAAKQEKYRFRVGSFEDTSFKQYPDMLGEWEQFYLPDEMKMKVFGVLEDFPCDSSDDKLVLMVCEDGKVFGYEEEMLHVVADNLNELFESGFQFPGTKQFYRGQSFEDVTGDEWDELKERSQMMKEHKKFLKKEEPSYLASLKSIMEPEHQHDPARMGGAANEVEPVF
ncbi:uncharacterized protein LOC134309263 [Trichomycterus rosablanca]|uniref:uncharacterized protein LOC134309263 n=1 Tax=Trichomycterus rosablanca TaxID=2290929 RepID=UPI002F35F782